MALFFKGLLLSQMSKTQAVLSKVFFTAIFPFRRAIVSTPFPALRFVTTKINAKTRGNKQGLVFEKKKILSDNNIWCCDQNVLGLIFWGQPPYRTFKFHLGFDSHPSHRSNSWCLAFKLLGSGCLPTLGPSLIEKSSRVAIPQPLMVERVVFLGGGIFLAGKYVLPEATNKQQSSAVLNV